MAYTDLRVFGAYIGSHLDVELSLQKQYFRSSGFNSMIHDAWLPYLLTLDMAAILTLKLLSFKLCWTLASNIELPGRTIILTWYISDATLIRLELKSARNPSPSLVCLKRNKLSWGASFAAHLTSCKYNRAHRSFDTSVTSLIVWTTIRATCKTVWSWVSLIGLQFRQTHQCGSMNASAQDRLLDISRKSEMPRFRGRGLISRLGSNVSDWISEKERMEFVETTQSNIYNIFKYK